MSNVLFNESILSLDKFLLGIKNINIHDTVVISGTPRSGTTWLMEIIGSIPSYTTVFEPLNPIWFPASRKLGFTDRPYISSEDHWEEGKRYFQHIFSGQMYKREYLYPFKMDMFVRSIFSNKLVVKFVRLNRLLPWISNNFHLKMIFFIIRHPCAVVSSQLNTGYTSYHSTDGSYKDIIPSIKTILKEMESIQELDVDIERIVRKLQHPEEILASVWCIDNIIPLKMHKTSSYNMIVYEKLVSNLDNQINEIFNSLNIKISRKGGFSTPSMVTKEHDKQFIVDIDKQLSKWKMHLSKKQIERILQVVKDFHMDFYSDEVEPDYDVLQHFNK